MENKSDYSFQTTVQTLAGLIADLQENQEIKFLMPGCLGKQYPTMIRFFKKLSLILINPSRF